MQDGLLGGRGELPRDLHAALLAEHEPQLTWWTEAAGLLGAEARARLAVADRTQKIRPKEAVFAACSCPSASVRHPVTLSLVQISVCRDCLASARRGANQSAFDEGAQRRIPENATTLKHR
jgi:hypothetical protein